MDIAVLSDIHGNYVALRKCLDYALERNIKTFIFLNSGAVGVSLHSEGKAQFLILNGIDGTWKHEFISLEYEVQKVISDLYESGLCECAPYWCKITEHLLQTGEISHGTVLAKAMALCREETGECNWPNVPEKYWEKAVEETIGK